MILSTTIISIPAFIKLIESSTKLETDAASLTRNCLVSTPCFSAHSGSKVLSASIHRALLPCSCALAISPIQKVDLPADLFPQSSVWRPYASPPFNPIFNATLGVSCFSIEISDAAATRALVLASRLARTSSIAIKRALHAYEVFYYSWPSLISLQNLNLAGHSSLSFQHKGLGFG